MNKFLGNLLLCFALALCGLCTFQWIREGKMLKQIGEMNDDLYKKRVSIQELEGVIKHQASEITRIDGIRNDLNQLVQTNKQQLLELGKYADKLEKETDNQKGTIENYKQAMAKANEAIQKQNADILKQNDNLKAVAKQRDDKVAELHKLAEDYNKVVGEFNKLQEAANKAAEAAAAAAANPDNKKK